MKSPAVKVAMPTVDYSKLLGRMVEYHHTRKSLAKATGVSETALGQWMLKGELLHGTVVWAIADRLEINVQEIPMYFYQQNKRGGLS